MEKDKNKNDVFLGNCESYSKQELANIINYTLDSIDFLVSIYPNEQLQPIKVLGKRIYDYIFQLNQKHIDKLQDENNYIDILEKEEKEKAAQKAKELLAKTAVDTLFDPYGITSEEKEEDNKIRPLN